MLPITLAVSQAWGAQGDNVQELEPVVVTATPQKQANVIQFNTKTAIQPLPANDGAGLLQSVPNMSIIRKGGTSGDPLFRGLGGSRLSITADDQFIYGGCGGHDHEHEHECCGGHGHGHGHGHEDGGCGCGGHGHHHH